MAKLAVPPDQNGYGVSDGSGVLSTKLDGGASRYRQDQLGAAFQVSVQWTVAPDVYDYLQAFFRSATLAGAIPFTIDLIIQGSGMATYTAWIVPGTWGLRSQSGYTYVVGATLEVLPNLPDTTYDAAMVDLFTSYPDLTGGDVLALLQTFVNSTLPGRLHL